MRSRTTVSLRAFLLVSLLLHALVVILWTGEPPSGMHGGGVLQVRLETGAASGTDGDRGQELVTPLSQTKPQERRSEIAVKPVDRVQSRVDVSAKSPIRVASTRSEPVETRLESRPSTKHREVILGKQSVHTPSQSQRSSVPVLADEGLEDADSKTAAMPQPAAHPASATRSGQGQPASAPSFSPVEGERDGMGGETYRMVQSALRKALLTRFDYPLLARRRGWEGRVRVALLVEPDGDLKDLHVVQSSGHRVLDEAALEDLREVGQLPEANVLLLGKELAVILPIYYRLR